MNKIDNRIKLHSKMFVLFKTMYKYINPSATFEEIKLSFLDEKVRNEIIMKSFEIDDLKIIADNYYQYDKQVAEIIENDYNQIRKYEEAYKKTNSSDFAIEDLDTYFECLEETLESYLNKKLDVNFKFYSNEMRNSIHSLINKNGERVEIDVNLSIPRAKVIHLMGIPGMSDENSVLSKLYNEYKKEYPNSISANDNNELGYVKFICLVAPKYIKMILNGGIPEEEKDRRICEKCEIDIDSFKKEISKSFEKIVNFKQIYEYKYIPEIIMDYEIDENTRESKQGNHSETEQHRFGLTSSAFTNKSGLVSFKDKFIKDETSKCGYIINDDIISEEDKQILYDIVEKLGTTDIKVNYNNGLKKENGKLTFKAYTPVNVITGSTKVDAQYVQYNYLIDSKELLSDLPPSIFLLSYNVNDLEKEELNDKLHVCQSISVLARIVAFEILKSDKNINFKLNGEKIDFLKDFKRLITILYRSSGVKEGDELFIEEMYENLSEKINDSKLNEPLFTEFVGFYLNNQDYIRINELKEYEKYINEDLLKYLSLHIKSFFIDDLASIHYRETFNIPTYNESQDVSVKDFDKHIPLNIVMNLAQKIKDEREKNVFRKNPERVSKTIGMVGFGIMREDVPDYVVSDDQDTIIDKYAKTFMGKTPLQLLMDLRINGWGYKLDTIYNDQEGLIVYNMNPISRNKKYRPLLEEREEYNKENPDLNKGGPKKGR